MAVSSTSRVFIVHNPVAGTSNASNVRDIFKDCLGGNGWSYKIHETSPSDDVPQIVREAEARGFDAILAAGGDGTVSAVANGLINRPTPLGIVPIGTGNALARELGIPLDAKGACNLLLGDHTIRRIDAMKVGEYYYVLTVGVGVSALTMADTHRQQKRRFGRLAYIWNGLRHLLSSSIWRFSVTIDDRTTHVRATEVVVTNAQILGVQPISWGPQVTIDDGQIDLCHVRAGTLAELLRSIAGLALGRQDEVPEIN
jgi:YegS/Rv2252/BmrU family lipid kinase